MERKRNRPEKYDRQLVHKTVKSMQKVEEVRALPPPLSSPSLGHLVQVFLCEVQRQPTKLHAEAIPAEIILGFSENFFRGTIAEWDTQEACVCVGGLSYPCS